MGPNWSRDCCILDRCLLPSAVQKKELKVLRRVNHLNNCDLMKSCTKRSEAACLHLNPFPSLRLHLTVYRFRCAALHDITIMVSPRLTHFDCLLLACVECSMLR